MVWMDNTILHRMVAPVAGGSSYSSQLNTKSCMTAKRAHQLQLIPTCLSTCWLPVKFPGAGKEGEAN